MLDYTGLECPVCGKPFTEQDEDIVVCPECGAPHHRECYTAHGKCGCADKHGTDQAWDRQNEPKAAKKPCPFCHQPNDENALFCVHCGRALGQAAPPPYGAPPVNGAPPFNPYAARGGYPGACIPFDPMGGVPMTETFDGVPAEDVAKVVRANTRFYLPVFARIKNMNRCRFSFVAFFLGGTWLLYRKQYKLGIVFTAINACVYAASMLLSYFFTTPIMMEAFKALNITSTTQASYDQLRQVGNYILTLPAGQIFLFLLPLLCSVISLGVNIFLGIRANRWYLHHCVQTAKGIQESSHTIMEREQAFQKKGGVNMAILLCVMLAYMLASTLSSYLVTVF